MSIDRNELDKLLDGRRNSEIFIFTVEEGPELVRYWAEENRLVLSYLRRTTFKGLLERDYEDSPNYRKNPKEQSNKDRFVSIPDTPFVRFKSDYSGNAYLQVRILEILKLDQFVDGKKTYKLNKRADKECFFRNNRNIYMAYNINNFREVHETGQVLTVDGPKWITGPTEKEDQDALV